MYKYGGVYLDADVLVVRPLDSLGEDWVVLKNNKTVYAAILSFSKQGLGHELVTQILK